MNKEICKALKRIMKYGTWDKGIGDNDITMVEDWLKNEPIKKPAYKITKEKEEYLFKIARAVLKQVKAEMEEEVLADMVMLELLNIKE